MLTRVITSVVALCVLIPVLILSDTWVLPIAVAVCCLIADYEMLKCIGALKKPLLSSPLLALSFALPITVRSCESLERYCLSFMAVALLVLLYLLAVLVFSKGSIGVEAISVAAVMSFYVTFGFSSIVLLHDFFALGNYTYLLVFVGAWITDVFAYFCGRLFGKHKLIPEVSPKKTVEGSIGGTFFCAVSYLVFGILAEAFFECNANLIFLTISGIFISVIAQVGDLIMSVIKRHYGIKDYGKIFPGHGGMLDRFDSILAVSLGVGAMCLLSMVTNIPLL